MLDIFIAPMYILLIWLAEYALAKGSHSDR